MEGNFQHQQPPQFDPNNLDEKYEIVFDYDANGNLRRVKKVRRYSMKPSDYFLLAIVIVIFFIVINYNYA